MVQPSLDKYFTQQLWLALIGVCSALTSFDGEVIFIVPYNVPSVTRELIIRYKSYAISPSQTASLTDEHKNRPVWLDIFSTQK